MMGMGTADAQASGDTGRTSRFRDSKLTLLKNALGPPDQALSKARRFVDAVLAYGRGADLDERLQRLHALGHIERIPTRAQLVVGAIDMLRFWIVPASEEYYAQKGIHFGFHQVLRFLDDPASLVDPTGFLSRQDVIIGHLMQVVHANPRYDLELLESYDGGLEALEAEVVAMIEGTHPRAGSISAIVEDAAYHRRLLEYVRAFRRDPSAPSPLRENVASSPVFVVLDRTFGSLPSAMRYFARLPPTWPGALVHLRNTKAFPVELGEPETE
jgi:hypothetical protein